MRGALRALESATRPAGVSGGVVYVVAKAPVPGACKTRLCPPLSYVEAAEFGRAFLMDALEVVHASGAEARVVCRDTAERDTLQVLLGSGARVVAQSGVGLGDALEGALREGLADGFTSVAVLGADSPTLDPGIVSESLDVTASDADVAIGPTDDGGYYLLAARRVYPSLFRGMEWSTSDVTAETVRRCRGLNLAVHFLPNWYDVDDARSLARLQADLTELDGSVASHTRPLLATLAPVLPVALTTGGTP